MMRALRLAALTSLGLILGAAIRVATVWDALPPVMASHFGASGRPDAFMSRAAFFGVFGGIAGVTALLLTTTPLWLSRIPASLVNIPNRDYWLAPERREIAMKRVGAFTAWMGVTTCALLVLVLELVLRANLRRGPLENGPFMVFLALYLAATVAQIVAFWRAFRVNPGRSER